MKHQSVEFSTPADINPETVYRFLVANVATNELGRIFSVVFVKKNGEIRSGRFRFGVKKGVKGTGRAGWPETREAIASKFEIVTAYDVDKVVIYETATGRVVATYDSETGERIMARKNPTAEELEACATFEATGGARSIKNARRDISPAYHAERGAFRNIPLATVLRIKRAGETLE